ncbi:MAG: protein-L-isoaspartate(D-aspartate) O-methyltransferase [Gemmatimonadales bacterium]|nr:protein-L-isoaspartate(D-aspartate) O-methyltransferase [Gemmatimonadales bacterium]
MRPFILPFKQTIPGHQVLAGLIMLGVILFPFDSCGGDYSGPHQRMMLAIHRDVARNSQVLGRDNLSDEVARAMARVERHLFVPLELRSNAYANSPLPIGHGQTISQPTIVAMMTDLLALSPADTVLEIGTGSGYQAAVLAEIVPGGIVHTIEIVPELARSARNRLATLGYDNIEVHEGDGYLGLPDQAPFTGIMVTAAASEIPEPLIQQLAPGGRLVMPVGPHGETQYLTLLSKNNEGQVTEKVVLAVRFVPLVRR